MHFSIHIHTCICVCTLRPRSMSFLRTFLSRVCVNSVGRWWDDESSCDWSGDGDCKSYDYCIYNSYNFFFYYTRVTVSFVITTLTHTHTHFVALAKAGLSPYQMSWFLVLRWRTIVLHSETRRWTVMKKRCNWLMSRKEKASWSHFQCLINLGVRDFPWCWGQGRVTSLLLFVSLSFPLPLSLPPPPLFLSPFLRQWQKDA